MPATSPDPTRRAATPGAGPGERPTRGPAIRCITRLRWPIALLAAAALIFFVADGTSLASTVPMPGGPVSLGPAQTSTPVLPPTATIIPPGYPGPVTATPPPTSTPVGGGGPVAVTDPHIMGRAPAVAIQAALANPDRVAGWGQPRNPNVPYDPLHNPYRTCLTLRRLSVPYHPQFNALVFKAGCP